MIAFRLHFLFLCVLLFGVFNADTVEVRIVLRRIVQVICVKQPISFYGAQPKLNQEDC